MNVNKPLQVTLNADGVTAPLVRAVRDTVETIGLALSALATANLSEAPSIPDAFPQFRYGTEQRSTEERKAAYTAWLLSKGFQDLSRGIREMLEEAYLYVGMYKMVGQSATWGDVEARRKEASDLKFPPLLAKINAELLSPLKFTDEFLSLQKVRNCLEHRAGVVSERDIGPDGWLRLVLPAFAMFAEEDGHDVEIYPGYFAKKDTPLKFKRISRERSYRAGERITFAPKEFGEIAHSCWLLSVDVGNRLPHPTRSAERT